MIEKKIFEKIKPKKNIVKMSLDALSEEQIAELACTYGSLILADDGNDITVKIK